MYIASGIDGAVMHKQAMSRRNKDEETTVVHAHSKMSAGRPTPCTDKCKVYEPGYLTRSVNAQKERIPEGKL